MAVDGAHVYWANYGTDTIGRAKLNGTGAEQSFITGASHPWGVAVDGVHVYWANLLTNTIGRAGLDGTGAEQTFITGAGEPVGSAVAPSPHVVGIEPASGAAAGGTSVTIRGSGFHEGDTVTIGAQATSVRVLSGEEITATTSATPPGEDEVIVTDPADGVRRRTEIHLSGLADSVQWRDHRHPRPARIAGRGQAVRQSAQADDPRAQTLPRLAGTKIESARVLLANRVVADLRGPRLIAHVNFAGLRKGAFKVRIVAKTSTGRTRTASMIIHTCLSGKRR